MAKTVVANRVQICLFWHNSLSYNEVSQWPTDIRAMWDAFGQTILALRQRHGQNVPVEMYVCPVTEPENAVIVSQNNLPFSLLPAAQVWAQYPDGTASNYFLTKDADDRANGVNWKQSDVQPYVEALLYRLKAAPQSLVCKLLPPLCSVGGWVWLALAAGATLKASSSKGVGKAAWTAGAGLLLWEWYSRGGLTQVQNLLKNEQ